MPSPGRTTRRKFMKQSAALVAVSAGMHWSHAANEAAGADDGFAPSDDELRQHLAKLLLSPQDVERWLSGQAFPFCKYDAELGYLHRDRDFAEGQDGAICRYRYDDLDARQMIAHADQPCRVNTYGNSFTSCEQVSDGETWQEVLASHLGEPIRNYGIGGYSVYQAYLRMLREEQRAPARYIIFHIFDDDHARNLHGWQRFKFGVNDISTNPTVPHVSVDPDTDLFQERPNPCPTAESIGDLCDLERAFELFRDDFYLRNRVTWVARQRAGQAPPPTDYDDQRLMRHGIHATTRIIDRVEEFARQNDKHVLYVLSFGAYTIGQFMRTGMRFDQRLVDFLDSRKLPYVDLMRKHADDAKRFAGSPDEALSRYFIGHYNPLGNLFCAFAIKDALTRMLDPKPPAYQPVEKCKLGQQMGSAAVLRGLPHFDVRSRSVV
jgi:hypothetical protein